MWRVERYIVESRVANAKCSFTFLFMDLPIWSAYASTPSEIIKSTRKPAKNVIVTTFRVSIIVHVGKLSMIMRQFSSLERRERVREGKLMPNGCKIRIWSEAWEDSLASVTSLMDRTRQIWKILLLLWAMSRVPLKDTKLLLQLKEREERLVLQKGTLENLRFAL